MTTTHTDLTTRVDLLNLYPPLWQAQVLIHLLDISNEKGEFDISDADSESRFDVDSPHRIEQFLFEAAEAKVVSFEAYAENGGFIPDRWGSVCGETYTYLKLLLSQLDVDIKGLNSRVESILAFNPTKIASDIEASEEIGRAHV